MDKIMKTTNLEVENVAKNISNCMYNDNLLATKELMELFNNITIIKRPLNTWKDYVDVYDDCFYTYRTFEDLIESEKYQNDGLTEEECKAELNKSIWQLPCGWYIQYV